MCLCGVFAHVGTRNSGIDSKTPFLLTTYLLVYSHRTRIMSFFYIARRVANILLRGSIQVRSYSTSAAGQKKNTHSEANVKSKKKENKKKVR